MNKSQNVRWFYMMNNEYYNQYELALGRTCGYPSDFISTIALGYPLDWPMN